MIYCNYRAYPNYRNSNFFIFVQGFNKQDAEYAARFRFSELGVAVNDLMIVKL